MSPHLIRHSTAVHLLEAGVELNVIRNWLGHVSLETPNRYAEMTLATKEKALEACAPPLQNRATVTKRRGIPRTHSLARRPVTAELAEITLRKMCPDTRAPPSPPRISGIHST